SAVTKEQQVAGAFESNWGYLRARPEECKPRAYETRLVKYFSGANATVKEKRLALEGEARGDTPMTPQAEKVTEDPQELNRRMAASMYRTTACEYGSRGSLELFGTGQHGTKQTISKLPF
ncbi:hypothetical protein T484DRAFT_1794285, partial [Baffinella frigidus]